MLQRLYVKNILFSDDIDIDLEKGLSVITGETGSGKSVLLSCIRIGLGDKLPASFNKDNTSLSTIFLEFDISDNEFVKNKLDENSIEYISNKVSIRRTFVGDKRSKLFINDTPASTFLVKELRSNLLEYQGQHSQATILDASKHIGMLDQFAKLESDIEELQVSYKTLSLLTRDRNKLEEEAKYQEREKDYLSHVIGELQKVSPEIGEENILSEKRRDILKKKKSLDSIKEAISIIRTKNIESSIMSAYKALTLSQGSEDETLNVDSEIDIVDKISIELSDLVESLDNKLQNVEQSYNANTIEERLFLLREVARKYRVTPDELRQFLDQTIDKLGLIEKIDSRIADLNKQISTIQKSYLEIANKISIKRKNAAIKLEEQIRKELSTLKMEKTIFKIEIQTNLNSQSSNGLDKVEFLVTNNPGVPVGPLKDISSGGELSRFMLAMRVVLTKLRSPPSIIFDEVDTGLGGAVADAVGEKLSILSNNYQLFVITHHPQVAVKAKFHYLIEKRFEDEKTKMSLKLLSNEEKKQELARMLSGKNITEQAISAANQLLSEA